MSIFRCIIIGTLIFGLLGILQVSYPQLNIAGVPQTAQQISVASDVIFGAGVPSFTENGVLLFIFLLALGFDAYICSRFKLGLAGFFLIGFIVICSSMGVVWMLMHGIIYSLQETKLFATFIFGWLGSTITLATGTFIFWLLWHFFNNAFIKLAKLIAVKEDIIFIALIIWFILLVLYVFGEILLHRYKKKKQEKIIVPE